MDSEGKEMPATAFNKYCDKFFDTVQEGKVYEIRGGIVRINDKKFTTVRSEYKLILDDNTIIEEHEDDHTIKEHSFNCIPINDIPNYPLYSVIDVMGYVLEASDRTTIQTRNGETDIRRVVICDDSKCSVDLTFWRDHAFQEIKTGQVIVCKYLKIGDYNGRNLSTTDASQVIVDPPEAMALKTFCENYKEEFKNIGGKFGHCVVDTSASSSTSYLRDILNEIDFIPDEHLHLTRIVCTILNINHSDKNIYPGCPDQNCKKKVTNENDMWNCTSCNKEYFAPTYYYTFSLRVMDCSSDHWIDFYGAMGEKMFKVTADEYKKYIENEDVEKLKAISADVEFKRFAFLVKPKMNIYNNKLRKKLNVQRIDNIDIITETRKLLRGLTTVLHPNK